MHWRCYKISLLRSYPLASFTPQHETLVSSLPLRPLRPLREALSSFGCTLRARGLGQCSVGEGPEIVVHVRWFRGVHDPLGEKDADHILGWIYVCRGAGAAVPTESAGVMG